MEKARQHPALGALAALLLAALPAAASAAAPAPFEFFETRWEAQPDGALWLRLRFVAPDLSAFEEVEDAFLPLCRSTALPLVAAEARPVALVVVSLSDRRLPFGEADPAAVQFFEAFRPEGADCVWEPF